jgi:hypothetical protein
MISGDGSKSVARLTPISHNDGVRLGDRVRQVYGQGPVAVPGGGGGGAPPGSEPGGGGSIKGIGSLLIGGLLLGLLLGGASSSSKGGISAESPGVAAAAGSLGNSVLVSWNLPAGVSAPDIVGHFIHRSAFPQVGDVIDFATGNQTRYFDQPGDFTKNVDISLAQGAGGVFNAIVATTTTAITGPCVPNTSNFLVPGTGIDDLDVDCTHCTPTPGTQFFYAVSRVIKIPEGLTPPTSNQRVLNTAAQNGRKRQAQTGEPTLSLSRPSEVSGGATALTPVNLVSPSTGASDVSLQNVTFEWLPTTGADTYQIQVSTNSSFPNNSRFESPIIRDTRQGVTLSRTLTNVFVPGATINTPIFWRVGARNSRDRLNPTGEGSGGSNDDNFVVGGQFQIFTLREDPPSPPQTSRVLRGNQGQDKGVGEARRRRRGRGDNTFPGRRNGNRRERAQSGGDG